MSDSVQRFFTEADLVRHPWLTTPIAHLIELIIKNSPVRGGLITSTSNGLLNHGITYMAELVIHNEHTLINKSQLGRTGIEQIFKPILEHCGLGFDSRFEGFDFGIRLDSDLERFRGAIERACAIRAEAGVKPGEVYFPPQNIGAQAAKAFPTPRDLLCRWQTGTMTPTTPQQRLAARARNIPVSLIVK
jgi:hypothetical protein